MHCERSQALCSVPEWLLFRMRAYVVVSWCPFTVSCRMGPLRYEVVGAKTLFQGKTYRATVRYLPAATQKCACCIWMQLIHG